MDEGTILDKSRLNPISVIPKLLGEKKNIVEKIPTNVQLVITYLRSFIEIGYITFPTSKRTHPPKIQVKKYKNIIVKINR